MKEKKLLFENYQSINATIFNNNIVIKLSGNLLILYIMLKLFVYLISCLLLKFQSNYSLKSLKTTGILK